MRDSSFSCTSRALRFSSHAALSTTGMGAGRAALDAEAAPPPHWQPSAAAASTGTLLSSAIMLGVVVCVAVCVTVCVTVRVTCVGWLWRVTAASAAKPRELSCNREKFQLCPTPRRVARYQAKRRALPRQEACATRARPCQLGWSTTAEA